MKAQSRRISMAATPLFIACGVLGLGGSAMAQSDGGHCSSRTLSGDYGYAAEGVLLAGPGIVLQFRSVGMTHFDGTGHLTWVEHTVVGGAPLELPDVWTPANGTYKVNPNCTGSATIYTPNSAVPLSLALVIVRQGNEIHTVLDAHAISTVFIKVGAAAND